MHELLHRSFDSTGSRSVRTVAVGTQNVFPGEGPPGIPYSAFDKSARGLPYSTLPDVNNNRPSFAQCVASGADLAISNDVFIHALCRR